VSEKISLLVPFRPDDEGREATWSWLSRYWRWALPEAELIVGTDDGKVFSKTWAVNQAARKATGDVFVIMDADCYMSAEAIEHAATEIRASSARSWWMPYVAFWRMRQPPSERLLTTDPRQPMQMALPPDSSDVQGGESTREQSYINNSYGGLCTVMPAAAFKEVGGMDLRFRGWGGEDTAFAAALDTLWAPRTYCGTHHAAHLWHARIGEGMGAAGRKWEGQANPGSGRVLKNEYLRARGHPRVMRTLVSEGLK
jgi:N-terminal domain of galactosyltransferase/Glycosyl transferase family 2